MLLLPIRLNVRCDGQDITLPVAATLWLFHTQGGYVLPVKLLNLRLSIASHLQVIKDQPGIQCAFSHLLIQACCGILLVLP